MWDLLKTLGTWGIVLELAIILILKMIEVSIGTIRSILVVKGYRQIGAMLAIVEILLWVFVASRVIIGLADDPLKGVFYSLGYAGGVYLGSFLEQKLAFGMRNIQIIANEIEAPAVCELLRENGYGITVVDGRGRSENRKIMTIYATRQGTSNVTALVESVTQDALIIVSDIISLKGGYYTKRRNLFK